MVEIMYSRIVKAGTFKIESAITLFKEEYSRIITEYHEQIGKGDTYALITLRYNYNTHKYYIITVYEDWDFNLTQEKIIRGQDTIEQIDSYYVGQCLIDKEAIRVFIKQNALAQKIALGIQNVNISPNDTQINVLTNSQNDAIYNELMESTFDEIFTRPEDRDSAFIELNHNPLVKPIISDLFEHRIDVSQARERLSIIGFEQEQLAYMFQILDEYYNTIPSTVNKIDSSPNPE
jgi:hypothetical protein